MGDYGKARITRRGDVTTVRVVAARGRRRKAATDWSSAPAVEIPVPADLEVLKAIDTIAFNRSAEQAFLRLLAAWCDKMPDGVPLVGLRAEAAFRLNISTETVKRYLEKYCMALSAPYVVRDGAIYRRDREER